MKFFGSLFAPRLKCGRCRGRLPFIPYGEETSTGLLLLCNDCAHPKGLA